MFFKPLWTGQLRAWEELVLRYGLVQSTDGCLMVGSSSRFVVCGQMVGFGSRFVGCGQLDAKGLWAIGW